MNDDNGKPSLSPTSLTVADAARLLTKLGGQPVTTNMIEADLAEAAQGAAALGSRREQVRGHGQKLTSKQETLIAALLTEPTYAAAAAKAGVGTATLYRWMHLPEFRAAYRRARRELVEGLS